MLASLKIYLMMAAAAHHDYWSSLAHLHFNRPQFFVLLPVLLYLAMLWGKRQINIRHPTLTPHETLRTWRNFSTVTALAYLALAFCVTNLNLAMVAPTVPDAKVQHLVQTRDICVFVDSSGSMTTVLNDGIPDIADDEAKAKNDPTAVTVNGQGGDKLLVQSKIKDEAPHPLTRVEAAQMAARYLIRNRMTSDPANTDRFCLMRFDMDTFMMAPLTFDKLVLLLRTVHMTENVGGGTNFAGPTGTITSVGPLQKAVDYFTAESAANATRVAVYITDGYDDIDPQRRQELIDLFEQEHIKVYVIGLGDGWKDGNTLDLQKFADELHKVDSTSGIVFRATNPGAMTLAMQTIDENERAQEVFETLQPYREVDYAFILGAIAWVLVFFCLATLARRIP
jgi:hypothetical protein